MPKVPKCPKPIVKLLVCFSDFKLFLLSSDDISHMSQ